MKNPWLRLKNRSPYVLRVDEAAIRSFNRTAPVKNKIWIDELLPVPYVGNVLDSKIVLLQANPGTYLPPGFKTPPDDWSCLGARYRKKYMKKYWIGLRQRKTEFPFGKLNPDFPSDGGFVYWSGVFSDFITSKSDYARLSKLVSCVEFFPYHSKSYKRIGKKHLGKGLKYLSSQEYGFFLVREAIKRKKTIIVMKKVGWLEAVPELRKAQCIFQKSRNVKLSKNNLKRGDFLRILKILKA